MKNKIVILATLIGTFFITNSSAQSSPSKFQEAAPRQNIYVELGGNGVAFNAMYESRLKKYKVTSPDGIEFFPHSLKEFCKENNLTYEHMVGLATKRIETYRNWKCEKIG